MAGKTKGTRAKSSDPASLPEAAAAIAPETKTGADTEAEQPANETVAPTAPAEETKTGADAQPEQPTDESDKPTDPVAAAPAEACPYNRSLRYGADGEDVRALQQALAEIGCTVEVTGVFDIQTVRAVQKRQLALGLPANGIIGKHEYNALLAKK